MCLVKIEIPESFLENNEENMIEEDVFYSELWETEEDTITEETED